MAAAGNHRLSLVSIAEAAQSIDPVFLHTPQFVSEGLSARLGCELTLKVETANPIGCFKGRGASYFVARSATSRVEPLVCASAGNFGQALAYACRSRGLPLTVFASVHANRLKIARMRAFGAHVELAGEDFDAAKLIAADWAQNNGARFVEDGREPEIAEGAGSIGVELTGPGKPFDAVLLPLGNGALLTGVARWMKAHSPETRMLGISSIHATAMHDSWKARRAIEAATASTIADGIAVRIPVPEAVRDMNGIVDDVLLIQESSIRAAMRLFLEEERLIAEPAGAVGLAALLEYPELKRCGRIATVLGGSNIEPDQMNTLLFTGERLIP